MPATRERSQVQTQENRLKYICMYFMHMYILHQYCMYVSCQDKTFLVLIIFHDSVVEHYFLDWIEILGAAFSENKA